jgi:pilus assembly protein Flp/PilA
MIAMLDSVRMAIFDDSGATAVEYGLIAALISIAGIAALTSMGSSLTTIYTYVSDVSSNAAN